jgi:hypothetical protein
LETGQPGYLSTAVDGEAVTHIAREATAQAMKGRVDTKKREA